MRLSFYEKRKQRVWTKKVKYDVRKNFADSRLRVKGRFVKKEDEEWIRLHPQTLHTYRLPDKPCWIAVYIKNETHFLKRVESVQA